MPAPGVRRNDNSDEAEAAMRAHADAPALTLTVAERDAVRHAIVEARDYARRRHARASNTGERLRSQGVMDAAKQALAILDPDTS